MKIKTYESMLILLFLMVGMSFQPFTTIGSNQESMSNSITEEMENNVISSDNYNGLIPNSLLNEESPNESLQSRYKPTVIKNKMSGNSYVSIENRDQDLPDEIITWSTVSEKFSNVPKSPYLTIHEDALIKVFDTNLVETLVRVEEMQLNSEIVAFFADYNVIIAESYPMLAIYVVLVEVNVLDSFVSDSTTIMGIKYVQPNYYYQTSYIPNDTEWNNQYGPQIIGMEHAWDVQLGDIDVVVAIIDTGIDYNHPDLGNYLPIGYDWYNNDPDPFDDNGHGTHVAGTVAATINNALGIAGVANVSFFAEKFLDRYGFGSDIGGANAIMHAVDMGADILSNSWGGYGESQVLEDAVNYAISNGVIVVAAAGNGNTNLLHYPSAYPDVIAVSGTDANDNRYTSSNYGDWIDIAAPGVNILSTVPWGYDYFTGTSMSTPHVSGVIALLMSQYPSYDQFQIENLLYATAVDLGDPGFDEYFGWGRIDASSAIIGLQDHNLRANVNTESIIPGDLTSIISGSVTNIGLLNETNVNITLSINDVMVNALTIPVLNSGSTFEIFYDFLPPFYGFYNVSVNVDPVVGEEVLTDNFAIKTVEAISKVINAQAGDLLAYGPTGNDIPYNTRWEIVDTAEPLAYIMDLWVYEPGFNDSEFLADTFILNPYTREYESIYYQESGILFPYWIQTNIQIGDFIDLFTLGGQEGYVVDETVFDYYGISIPVWVVDDNYELVFFSKADGELISVKNYSYISYFDLVYSNVPSEAFNLHNMRIVLGTNSANVGELSNIEVFVQNTGVFYEETQVLIKIQNETIGLVDVFLFPGEYSFLTFSWTPPTLGEYFVQANIFPVLDEIYLDDNYDERLISVVELENYSLSFPSFDWFDAANNGVNLDLWGDDITTTVSLPFYFEFYDTTFDTVYVSSNGWMSFADQNPYEYIFPGFPSSNYPYAVAPFWADLMAEGNVFVWTTSDFVVIEYLDYRYLSGNVVGTFEVVFFATGEILFQYQYLNNENSNVGKGINYGPNLNYFTMLDQNLSGTTNFAALFTKGDIVGTDLDIAAGLNIPNDLEAGKLGYIQAYVQNVGSVDAEFVKLSIFIEGEQVATIFTELLLAGETLWLNHYWVPPYNGQFLIEAIAAPLAGEANINNNSASKYAVVGAIHDLVVFLDITHVDKQDYVIDGTVLNIGETEEYNVELYIYINGDPVALGEISTLKAGLSFVVSHYWTTNEAAEVAVFASYVPNEINLENNLVVELFEPAIQQNGFIVLQVNDLFTGDGIANADVYISGSDYFVWGQTNSSGGFEVVVPLGEYWVDILKDGYFPQSLYVVLLNPGEIAFQYVELEPIGELFPFEVQVEDQLTALPIEGAEVYISGEGFFAFGHTDQNGTFLTEIPLGEYFIDIIKDGYFREYIDYNFDVPENNRIFFYLEPLGDLAHLDVIVLDLTTDLPVAFADLLLNSPRYFEYGQTNESGIYSTFVPVGEYWIDVIKDGYFRGFEFIIIDNPDLFYMVVIYLDPETTEPMEFNIISPTGNEIINGALVHVFFEATNSFEIEFIDVFVNDLYVTTINWLPETSIFVPVFEEGYNNITLMAQWLSGQIAWTSVLIQTINLELYAQPITGDHIDFRFELFYYEPTLIIDFNLTVVDWVSSNEVLFDLVYHIYDESGTVELSNYYLVVNMLNGYISDSDMWWLYQHFYFFSGLASPSTTNIGDTFPFWSWGDVLTITGTSTWNDFEVWTFTDVYGILNGYVLQENGLFVYYVESGGEIIGEVIDSSLFPDFIEIPVISDLTDMTYEEGSLGNQLSWTATSEIPDFYIIFLDGVDSYFGNWTSLNPISLYIDGLSVGEYLFEIIVFDLNGNYAYDQVIVTVIDSTPPFVSTPDDITYGAGSTGNTIIWIVADNNPENYTVVLVGVFVIYDVYNQNDTITVNIDGLDVGIYEVEIFILDKYGNYAIDVVIVEVLDVTPPYVRGQPDFTYEVDSTENYVVWNAWGDPSGTYMIYKDSLLLNEGNWTDNSPIELNIDGLEKGRYNFTIVVFDINGNSMSDTTIVYVIPEIDTNKPPGRVFGFEIWLTVISIMGLIFLRKRKLNT